MQGISATTGPWVLVRRGPGSPGMKKFPIDDEPFLPLNITIYIDHYMYIYQYKNSTGIATSGIKYIYIKI